MEIGALRLLPSVLCHIPVPDHEVTAEWEREAGEARGSLDVLSPEERHLLLLMLHWPP